MDIGWHVIYFDHSYCSTNKRLIVIIILTIKSSFIIVTISSYSLKQHVTSLWKPFQYLCCHDEVNSSILLNMLNVFLDPVFIHLTLQNCPNPWILQLLNVFVERRQNIGMSTADWRSGLIKPSIYNRVKSAVDGDTLTDRQSSEQAIILLILSSLFGGLATGGLARTLQRICDCGSRRAVARERDATPSRMNCVICHAVSLAGAHAPRVHCRPIASRLTVMYHTRLCWPVVMHELLNWTHNSRCCSPHLLCRDITASHVKPASVRIRQW